MTELGRYQKAFNLGSDARLLGYDRLDNPFWKTKQATEYLWWDKGWINVDQTWGIQARWPFRRLPRKESLETDSYDPTASSSPE